MPHMMQSAPAETVADPAFQKLSDAAIQALANMQKMCHQTSPDSPLVEVLNDIQKVVAEVESQYQTGGGQEAPADPMAEDPMGPEGMDPGAELPPEAAPEQDPAAAPMDEAQAPEPSGNPMFDAAASLQADMQADEDPRKKRL
jgi:hypothetical protein